MIEIVSGIISGSITSLGMGGGTILIIILSNFLGLEQHIAQATNLVFFIPTAVFATIVNFKQKNVNIKIAISIILSGIIGVIFGVKISKILNAIALKKYFGFFLFIIGLNEIYSLYKLYIKDKRVNNIKRKKYGGN